MKTRLTLRPGQPGTQEASRKYGDRLLTVRYIYDAHRGRRLKTVELIEEELPWDPPAEYRPDEPVAVFISLEEQTLRARVRSAGGRWDRIRKLWNLPYHAVLDLSLEPRIR